MAPLPWPRAPVALCGRRLAGAVGCAAAALGPGSEASGREEAARPARDPARGGGRPRGYVVPARPGPTGP